MITQAVQNYLCRNDKFAVRMSSALGKRKLIKNTSRTFNHVDKGLEEDQAELFIDRNNIKFGDDVTIEPVGQGKKKRKG